ncbi:hypothetical protein [Methylotenera sp.]|uniref:hypothetical protein n=1 Tax=Methylotenera sp. TaxID=2051956 RepID=UPI0024898FF1|nr:hypothetical protein [Methylotenera sp.]MDI1362575.1 hypothetical protein [Methylotenera sp.]
MKIITKNGKDIQKYLRDVKPGECFRYISGAAIYLMTSHSSACFRMTVNLETGGTATEKPETRVVPIYDIAILIEDAMMTNRGEQD